MATQNRPVIGYIPCSECGRRASVHQAARGKGRFLYTRCDECGCDQRTGKAVQTRLYYGMERVVDDVEIKRPANVPEEQPENLESSKVPAVLEEPETQPDEPELEPETTEPPQPKKEPKGAGMATAAILGVGLGFCLKIFTGGAI
ncbi:hypothetical protein ACFOEK_12180 [Litoribrevibacter euphylliae]|uniref:Zinc finger/thioredoxin putative domain-containing protein n=1 Tax=Litoribrevibacter euphylliae TaxID=1834034 RepID=A0ABV7HD18_9GAMM